jgi:hypothetical protein
MMAKFMCDAWTQMSTVFLLLLQNRVSEELIIGLKLLNLRDLQNGTQVAILVTA